MRSGPRKTGICVAVAIAATLAGPAAPVPAAGAPPATIADPTTTLTTPTTADAGTGRYRAEIRRTEYGIPHIKADDFGSVGYGEGYAFAQDNLCVMADRVLTLRGERSKYFGPTAGNGDALSRAANLESDLYFRGVQQAGTVRRLLAEPAPLGPTARVRAMVDGYVAGYNRYLHDTGVANLPDPTCRGKSWVTPITALDVWAGLYDVDQLGGLSEFKTPIGDAAPPTANATTAERPAALPATAPPPADPSPRSRGIGSNGWALGRDATVAHDGMLLANPHYPWNGDGRFYQMQLTVPGVMDVSGVALYGTPVVEIGHTRGLAWTHTVSTADRYTIYQLSLVPGDPTSYYVDGRPEHMTERTVTVDVLDASGKPATVSRTLYDSRYGPVLGIDWTTTTALSVRGASAGNLRAPNEWLAMDTSQSVEQLRDAQDRYQGIPFVNTIATDTAGTAYYADAGVVPHVTDAQAAQCRIGPPGDGPLDGSKSACAWGDDPDAIEPGVFGPARAPRLTRTDFVANSNDSPWLTNPAAPLTGYPAIFGAAGSPLSLRSRLGLEMIGQRLAGTDGLGRPGFTLAGLQAVELDDRELSGELARDAVVTMCRAEPVLTAGDGTPVDVRAACAALAAWDGRGDAASHGEVLWETFFLALLRNHPSTYWRVPFDPAHATTTPNGFIADDPNVRQALADTVRQFAAHGTPPDTAPGDARRWAGVPLNGCSDLAGCFNVVWALPTSGPTPGPESWAAGSSFVMSVELTPAGPRARTILTYSESADPASPHSRDQTVLFSHKQWVTERFTEAEIHADPQLQTTVLRG